MDTSLQWGKLDEAFAKAWLLSIAQDLEIGNIPHARPGSGEYTVDWLEANGQPGGHYFNMATVVSHSDESECGTCACIGGWLALKLGITDPDEIENWVGAATGAWGKLFYPPGLGWNNITPQQAAKAIRAFVSGAQEPWEHIV